MVESSPACRIELVTSAMKYEIAPRQVTSNVLSQVHLQTQQTFNDFDLVI